ncbi:MAG TPA: hypothetical protein VGH06_04590, partial [Candidatus Udaeobacter sp.]
MKPFYRGGIRLLWKKDCFVGSAELFPPLKGVIQKLAHRHSDVLSLSRAFCLDEVSCFLFVTVALKSAVFYALK